ncbi:MAG TPA: hypothetical protein VJ782_06385 [Aeromicrobium sp.]|nr:hypothetical protein [Aeromicrobium sp.]
MSHGWARRWALLALLCSVVVVGGSTAASAADYAPLDRPGPALAPTQSELDASLTCTDSVDDATTDVVLLSPGTATTSTESFGWNWEPALDQLDIPWCAMDLPDQALGPIDVAAQYIVHAIRTVSARSGRKVDILGWSQGGMSMRWSLRFWPDTRELVDDVIGFAASNHGTDRGRSTQCAQLGCRAAVYQQSSDSEFIRALNSRTETFAGISYTNIYSKFDEVVVPNSGPDNCVSCLTTGDGDIANIQTQELCPLDISDHVLIGVAAATYAVVVDALTHDGPAVLSRIARAECNRLLMPGVTDPASAKAIVPSLQGAVGTLAIAPGPLPNPVVKAPVLHAEPTLPCYVYATCEATEPTTTAAPASAVAGPSVTPAPVDPAATPAATDEDTDVVAVQRPGLLGTLTDGLLGQRH